VSDYVISVCIATLHWLHQDSLYRLCTCPNCAVVTVPLSWQKMSKLVAACIVLIQLLAASQNVEAVTTSDLGSGTVYTLQVVKDVSLERSTTNFNYLDFLLWVCIKATQESDLYCNLRTSHPTVLKCIGQRCTYTMSILTKLAFNPSSKLPSSLATLKYTWWKKSGKKVKPPEIFEKLGCHGLSHILIWMVLMLRKKCWIVSLSTQAVPEALLNLTLLKLFAAGRKVVPTMVL